MNKATVEKPERLKADKNPSLFPDHDERRATFFMGRDREDEATIEAVTKEAQEMGLHWFQHELRLSEPAMRSYRRFEPLDVGDYRVSCNVGPGYSCRMRRSEDGDPDKAENYTHFDVVVYSKKNGKSEPARFRKDDEFGEAQWKAYFCEALFGSRAPLMPADAIQTMMADMIRAKVQRLQQERRAA